ncbi:MAG TPA: DedA family protein [Ktedonobacterales bacterium]|nr:DedA family protein [Ktedonobacterales bacterium]
MEIVNQFIHSLTMIPPLAVYGFVLLWLALESCGVPLPNELVLLLTGSLAAAGHLSPFILVGAAIVGSLIGASAAYGIGKFGGRAAVLRLGRLVRLDEERFASVERWFARSGTVAIFLSRITPFVRTVASFPAGVLRMPLRNFWLATLAGSLIWCSVLVGVGDALGANYTIALTLIQRYTIPAVIVLVALIAGYLWLHNRLSRVAPANGQGSVADTARKANAGKPDLSAKTTRTASTPLSNAGASARAANQKNGRRQPAAPSQNRKGKQRAAPAKKG